MTLQPAPQSPPATNGTATNPGMADSIRERDGLKVPTHDDQGYSVREQPMGTKRRLRAIVMGAGMSTINFLKKLEEQMTDLDVCVYEKNADVGGTWLENRYPGCQCDIPSVNYQYSWKIKIWTHYYSYSPEIWAYLKDIAVENDFVRKYIKLRHRIERAAWDNVKGLWQIRVRDLETDEVRDDAAEIFINAGGVLNHWKWPDVPGLEKFKGKLMHTACYEEGYDLKGKRVAVLGAGSSGVQCVAKIQKEVAHLYSWVRSPIWITAGFAQSWAGKDGANFEYTPAQREFLEKHPKKYLEYRKHLENDLNQRFKFIIKGSEAANEARTFSFEQMERKLRGDQRLMDKVIPKTFNPGCRRPTPAPGYLEALVADNSTVYTDPIGCITENGFKDHQGTEHEIDVLICATGFDTSWLPRFPFLGKDGGDLRDQWSSSDGRGAASDVTSYLAIGVPNFPNHWTFCGPYGPLGHGSFIPLAEAWTDYIFQSIRKMQVENIKSLTPSAAAARQFRQHADLFLQRTAWTSACRSWFKQGREDGQAAIWPGSRLHFLEMMKTPRWEDYEFEWWDDNRFAFLGNGFEMREFDGRDITNYLGCLDDEGRDLQPVWDEGLVDKLAGWAVGK